MNPSSSTPCGYFGRALHVDVSSGESRFNPIPEPSLRQFIGGAGLGAYLLHTCGAASVDPLAAEAPLIFTFSPLVGSPLTTSAKFAVVCKSPLTDRFNDSLASSGFAIAGKKTGADAIVIAGKASEPSVLLIDNGVARIEPANDLWGAEISQTQVELGERFGSGYRWAVIGPAGEKQVRFATISHDGRHAGRGGSGAVLGAKNIKAVGVRGDHKLQWADTERLVQLAKNLSEKSFGPATAKYRELGTAANLLLFNRLNALPTRNFQSGSFAGAEQLSPDQLAATRAKSQTSCVACTIGCEHLYGLPGNEKQVRLEYENLFALGPLCDVNDPDVVLTASHRCDELGIDTISAGGVIAFAMEARDRGLLVGDCWPRFGDAQSLLDAIEAIGNRTGVGEQLALGSRRLAESVGGDAASFAAHVKGLELPGYEPRSLQTMALGLAVGTRGADHNRSGAYEADFSTAADRKNLQPSAAPLAIETEDRAAVIDSLILCKFLRGALEDFYAETAEMLQCITGWDIDANELRQTARRIITAKKLFNIAAGWKPNEDTLPPRFFDESLTDARDARLSREQLQASIRAYNELRGWTPEGYVPDEELAVLGLRNLNSHETPSDTG